MRKIPNLSFNYLFSGGFRLWVSLVSLGFVWMKDLEEDREKEREKLTNQVFKFNLSQITY